MPKKSFGNFAKEVRLEAGFGLRDAARRMKVSAAYLSRVENDVDPASADLTARMATLYEREIEDFHAAAARPAVAAEARGRALQLSEELRALYRMGGSLSPDEVEDMIRYVLKKRGLGEPEIERELAQLRAELPRIRNNQGDGLFAADIKPRCLSKRGISAMAYRLLASNGLDQQTYVPPTPIELLAEKQEGITYKVSDLPASKNGDPIVLGLSKWNGPSERQVVISSALADSTRQTDAHRFSFTLGHELFHAIEHLPRAASPKAVGLLRFQVDTAFVERYQMVVRKTAAQRAVDKWSGSSKRRMLLTNEDWREWQANTFAAALLMPEWSVIAEFAVRAGSDFVDVPRSENLRTVALEWAGGLMFGETIYAKSLAEVFDVSTQAMAIRLLDLGLVREVQGQ